MQILLLFFSCFFDTVVMNYCKGLERSMNAGLLRGSRGSASHRAREETKRRDKIKESITVTQLETYFARTVHTHTHTVGRVKKENDIPFQIFRNSSHYSSPPERDMKYSSRL